MTHTDGTLGRGRSLPPKRNLWQRLMITHSFRSPCCYGKITRPEGWRREYCSKCQSRIW